MCPLQPIFTRLILADEGSSSSLSSSYEDSSSDEEDKAMLELERKRKHPQRLHSELWHNEPGEVLTLLVLLS